MLSRTQLSVWTDDDDDDETIKVDKKRMKQNWNWRARSFASTQSLSFSYESSNAQFAVLTHAIELKSSFNSNLMSYPRVCVYVMTFLFIIIL